MLDHRIKICHIYAIYAWRNPIKKGRQLCRHFSAHSPALDYFGEGSCTQVDSSKGTGSTPMVNTRCRPAFKVEATNIQTRKGPKESAGAVREDGRLRLPTYERKVFEIRLTTALLPSSLRSLCSHTLRTRMSMARRSRATRRARLLFPSTLDLQYPRFPLGSRRHLGHPCQKHPSTKSATRALLNQKSGWPRIARGWSRQPFTSALTSANRRRPSVDLFPTERTLDINSLRSHLVRLSMRKPLNRP